ncbi:MAG: efflux RND transporter permease subunit [Psychrobium sp.]
MEKLTKFGIERSRFTIFVMFALMLLGLSAYSKLSKREDPSITIRTAVVNASFEGMSPQKAERLIAEPLERIARQVSEVDEISTLIVDGQVLLYLNIYKSLANDELPAVFQEIRNKMADAHLQLPQGTDGPYVNTNYGDVAVATVAVTGHGFNYAELRESSRALRKHLYGVKGIGKVDLLGVQEERVWLEFDARKLEAIGGYLPQIIDDLKRQNVISSAGKLDAQGTSISLEVNGELKRIESISDLVIKIPNSDTLIRLGDLLTVRKGIVDPKVEPVFFNGQPAVALSIQMRNGGDVQVIGKAIKEAVIAFEQTQPIGIEYSFSTYQEEKVTKAIDDALMNVLQTAAVVLIVLMIFLGMRPALIVACIVPFSVMFAMILMRYIGVEIQTVSIAAVIISLGLLVDNGLVIVEDIQRQMAEGKEPSNAAQQASKQFAIPLAIASITTVAAFLPLFLIDGTDGEYGFSLGAVVALMLVGSWLTSIYILPALCVWLAKKTPQATNKKPSFLARTYRQLVTRSLGFSVVVVIAAYGLVVLASGLFGDLKNEMFPMSARNQYLVYMDMPKGTSIKETEQVALSVEKWISDEGINPEVMNTTTYVGSGGPRFYLALNPADSNPATAFILVNTQSFEGTEAAVKRAQQYVLLNHPEARFKIKQLSLGGAESGIVDIKISGPQVDRLIALSKTVEGRFNQVPGIVQNENDWGNKHLKVTINVAQDKARNYGVTSQDISSALQSYFMGSQISSFREGTDSFPIMIRAEEGSRDSIEDLDSLTLAINGKTIALESIATFEPNFELSQMRRFNQKRVIKISAKSSELSAQQLLAFIQPTLDSLDLTGGYAIEISGEVKDSAEVNEMLANGMMPALLLMLAAIMFQFNSARRVVIIFLTIPFIIIGSPLALIITGEPLSFFGTLGMISLAGIIINNAIVLIDQIDIERKTQELRQAIVEAAVKRVSPILLTTLTTVIGLVPMAISGGAMFEPMATLMIGGLLVASVVSVFFVPSLYFLFFKRQMK